MSDIQLSYNYNEPKLADTTQNVRIETISGNLQQVSTVPTWSPKTFRDSIALDTTSGKLYYYDFSNQIWRTVGSGSSYGGNIESNGTAVSLPTGWSSVVSGGHVYTITHNLGTTSYTVVANAWGSNSVIYFIPYYNFSSNTFTVEFDEKTGTTAGVTD